ncbi:MAG TPA: type II toxin-antitoxin system HicB family antitoxin [Patescibacteria group bacterium]|nr:type II toxin-antitoxin system HicB family antitoxin [Patescibacteria group bacterium]
MIKNKTQFTAVFEKSGKWYLGWVEEIPGANTQGKTLKEAKENLKEALAMVIEANREHAQHLHRSQQIIRIPITPAYL